MSSIKLNVQAAEGTKEFPGLPSGIKCVVFDCDGVLVDAISSWRTLHDHFGTDNSENLRRFIAGEFSDVEFMRSDIKLWKAKKDPIHRDELFRAYSGSKLMDGARELVSWLKDNGCFVAIVSAGVDLFVGSIASMLGADDWVANGFIFDEDGYLTDEGNCRLHATGKGEIIEKLCQQHGFESKEVISVGDSEMDLSMWIKDSKFIGFNPTRESSKQAFQDAGVPVINIRNCLEIKKFLD
jgi:phosphoserine phosphatase